MQIAARLGREFLREAQVKLKIKLKHLVIFHCDINQMADRASITFEAVLATLIFVGGCFWTCNLCEIHVV